MSPRRRFSSAGAGQDMRNFAACFRPARRAVPRTPPHAGRARFFQLAVYLCLAACRAHGPSLDPDLPQTRVASMSRVLIPANGGRTIHVPRFMGDAHALWSPLRRTERAAVVDYAALSAEARLDVWTPHAEETTVRRYLHRLLEERRSTTDHVLRRARRYLPVALEGMQRQGLPAELACLPLVESAFEPRCVSSAGAAGLWQLMPQTARRFGLTVSKEKDERFDVEKSTAAAARYLAYLHGLFRDWPLALAAYNCGEGAMQKAVRRYGDSLEEITRKCRNDDPAAQALREETLRFVPQFAAAVLVLGKSPELGLNEKNFLPLQAAGAAPMGKSIKKDTWGDRARNRPEKRRLAMQGSYDAPAGMPRALPRISRIP